MKDHEYYEQLISRMVDGEFTPDEQNEIQNHIASCEECRALYEAFSLISSELSDLAEPPGTIAENVMAAVRRKAIVRKNRKNGMLRAAAAVAACAVLVMAGARVFPRMGASSAATAAAPMSQMSMAMDSEAAEGESGVITSEPAPMPEAAPAEEAAMRDAVQNGGGLPLIFCDEAAQWISEKEPVTVPCPPDAEIEIQFTLEGELVTDTFITAGDKVYHSPTVCEDGTLTAVPANCSLEEFNKLADCGN